MSVSRVEYDGHRVVITFDDGVNLKLICPESGCSPPTVCICGRHVDDTESEGCYDCKDGAAFRGECWIKGWFDNCMADELLAGTIGPVPIVAEWHGDRMTVTLRPDLAVVPPTEPPKACPLATPCADVRICSCGVDNRPPKACPICESGWTYHHACPDRGSGVDGGTAT